MKVKELCGKVSQVLAAGLEAQDSYKEYFNAAVLVPLVSENDQISILFEVRSTHLSWQPGEICFPGGRIEKMDDNPLAAAVRETNEELGLGIDKVEVLGALEEVISPMGVRIFPFIAYLTDMQQINPNSNEVHEVFTVPLEFLLAAQPITAHMEIVTRPSDDFPFELLPGYSSEWKSRRQYQVLFYQYRDYVIWGLTAQILHNFLEIYRKV